MLKTRAELRADYEANKGTTGKSTRRNYDPDDFANILVLSEDDMVPLKATETRTYGLGYRLTKRVSTGKVKFHLREMIVHEDKAGDDRVHWNGNGYSIPLSNLKDVAEGLVHLGEKILSDLSDSESDLSVTIANMGE